LIIWNSIISSYLKHNIIFSHTIIIIIKIKITTTIIIILDIVVNELLLIQILKILYLKICMYDNIPFRVIFK